MLECLKTSFSHIFYIVMALPNLSVMIYLVPVSMKPLLTKSVMCSDWLAEVCVLIGKPMSVFQ